MKAGRKRLEARRGMKVSAAYRCEVCGYWHLTSMVPDKFKGKKEIL